MGGLRCSLQAPTYCALGWLPTGDCRSLSSPSPIDTSTPVVHIWRDTRGGGGMQAGEAQGNLNEWEGEWRWGGEGMGMGMG